MQRLDIDAKCEKSLCDVLLMSYDSGRKEYIELTELSSDDLEAIARNVSRLRNICSATLDSRRDRAKTGDMK